ncbi:hypothetical protein [Paraburkholderia hospita]|uniref:hypothetical protein n=1 Tax=Paraburkholderia hospita TaxID=169430 RepID=UPI001F61B1A5|nr:hypothetical protein [Paraburkholderia hospita]
MASHLFIEFPEDEQADVIALLADFGFEIAEFRIVDEDVYPDDRNVGPVSRQVTVTRLANETTGSYKAGLGTSWVGEFADDLRSGSFDL